MIAGRRNRRERRPSVGVGIIDLVRARVAVAPAVTAHRMNFAVDHRRCERAPRRRHAGTRTPAIGRWVVFVNLVGRHPAVDVAADQVDLAVQSYRGGVMDRAGDGRAAAPAVGGGVIDFQFELAAEAAEHVDLAAHLGDRDLGALRGHGGARRPAAGALGQCRRCEQHRGNEGGREKFARGRHGYFIHNWAAMERARREHYALYRGRRPKTTGEAWAAYLHADAPAFAGEKAVLFEHRSLANYESARFQYNTVGFAGEPVPPTIRSGAQMNAPS